MRGVAAWATEREAMSVADQELYADQFAAVSRAIHAMEVGVGPALEVSEAVLQALTAPQPKTRYPVGPHMDTLDALVAMPDRERDQVAMGILGLGCAPPSPA